MSWRLRWVSIMTACTLAAFLAPMTAADTPVPGGHSGNYGEHYLLDTAEYPGVRCSYGDDQFIDTMRIKPPVVFAYDSSSATNQQTVGWKYYIEQSLDSPVAWSVLAASTVQKATATDVHNAHFNARTYNVGSPNTVYLRVRVRMLWYRSGSVVAKADHLFDYYRMSVPAFGAGYTDDDDNCLYFYT
jgi:hypothetical protein